MSKCGLCLPDKPCNLEYCPDDTVLAGDYNRMLEEKNAEIDRRDDRIAERDKRISELSSLLDASYLDYRHLNARAIELESQITESQKRVGVLEGALGSILLRHDDKCKPTCNGLHVTWECVEECTDSIIRTALSKARGEEADYRQIEFNGPS